MMESSVTDGGRARVVADSLFYQDLQKKYPTALNKMYKSASPHPTAVKVFYNYDIKNKKISSLPWP